MKPALFLIHDLRMGGAERGFVSYVNNVRAWRPVPVVVRPHFELANELDPGARVYDLSRADLEPYPPDRLAELQRAETWLQMQDEPTWIGAEFAALARKARRLDRLATQTGARIVSTFLHKSHIIAMCAKLFVQPALRVVINVHEQMSQHLDHHFPHPLRHRTMREFTRLCFPRADLIVTVAEGVARDLVQHFDVPPQRIAVIPNPLDVQRIRARAEEPLAEVDRIDGSGPVMLAVGRLVHLKGFDLLLRAFAALPRDLGARLLILGGGEERTRLTELSQRLGIADSVRMPGAVDNPWQFMARADMLVLSSRTEAFPTVIGEALALGLPVVAADCSPGVREYLLNGECGILVRPESTEALTVGMMRLLQERETRKRLSERGLARARELDLPGVVQAYERALATVG